MKLQLCRTGCNLPQGCKQSRVLARAVVAHKEDWLLALAVSNRRESAVLETILLATKPVLEGN